MFSDAIWWSHNKSNMADGRHIENRILAISPRFIVRLTQNLVCYSTIMFGHRSSDQINNFRKFKMADGRHIENRLLPISPTFIVRLTRNFVWRSRITFRHRSRDENTKFWKFKMADGRHFENGLSLYLGRESSDFDEIWCADSNFGSRTATCWFIKKNMKFKFKMADSRHIENRILAISPQVIVRLTRYLARTSRTMLRHTPRDENSNFRKFKMADDGHFKNGFITISQPRIIRFQWNLVCHCRFWFWGRSRDKVSKFCKFKMADGRHIENRFWLYLNDLLSN